MKRDQDAGAAIQRYLRAVAAHLESAPDASKRELLRDLESHIYEALEARGAGEDPQPADVEEVLAGMDPPESFARRSEMRPRPAGGAWALLVSLGTVAFATAILLLGWGVLPFWIPLAVFLAGQLAALAIGVAAWADPLGKAAVTVSAGMTVCVVLVLILSA